MRRPARRRGVQRRRPLSLRRQLHRPGRLDPARRRRPAGRHRQVASRCRAIRRRCAGARARGALACPQRACRRVRVVAHVTGAALQRRIIDACRSRGRRNERNESECNAQRGRRDQRVGHLQRLGRLRGARGGRWPRGAEARLAARARPVRRLPARGDDRRHDRHRVRVRRLHGQRSCARFPLLGQLPRPRRRRRVRRAGARRQGGAAPGVRTCRPVRAERRRTNASSRPATRSWCRSLPTQARLPSPTRHETVPMHPLDEATALSGAPGDPVRQGRTSDAYWTFIGPFGGASAATALRAVLEHPQREGDPLAVTVNFCAPIERGEFAVHVRRARCEPVEPALAGRVPPGRERRRVLTASIVTAARRGQLAATDGAVAGRPQGGKDAGLPGVEELVQGLHDARRVLGQRRRQQRRLHALPGPRSTITDENCYEATSSTSVPIRPTAPARSSRSPRSRRCPRPAASGTPTRSPLQRRRTWSSS